MKDYVTYRALFGYFVLWQIGEFVGKAIYWELTR